MSKTRNESQYRNTVTKDGRFSPHLNKATSERIAKYCHSMNINKTRFVEQCVNECLDTLEREFYEALTKEELINLILK